MFLREEDFKLFIHMSVEPNDTWGGGIFTPET